MRHEELYGGIHQHSLSSEEGPLSSEESSGLHSPIFDPVIGRSRYQTLNDQASNAAALPATSFDYHQQPPLIKLESSASPFQAYPQFQSLVGPVNFTYGPRLSSTYDQSCPVLPHTMPSLDSSPNLTQSTTREPRKQTSTAVIACRQCRGRKIKCDSTRPVCNNCVRRSNVCEYDAVPKRRGPDKHPGKRQRSCKKRPADGSAPPPPKRKRVAPEQLSDHSEPIASTSKQPMVENKRPPLTVGTSDDILQPQTVPSSSNVPATDQVFLVKPESSPLSARHPYSYGQSPYIESDSGASIWWDEILNLYSLEDIGANLSYLFSDTGHWLSFLNVSFLLQSLSNPLDRLRIQPAFILAGLAMANLMRSSQTEFGAQGRTRALWLREAAQRKLEESWTSGWIDYVLAQAALILALFETSAHPQYHPDRVISSLNFLDSIIRRLGLTTIDAHDRDVIVFPERTVPVVDVTGPDDFSDQKCHCLSRDSVRPSDPHNPWSCTLRWDPTWSSSEVRDEESRRVCWCALGLVANFTAQCAAFDRESPDLFLTDPSNYALLFPGEVIDRNTPSYGSVDPHSPKDSVWALYCRSMLLWCFCNRFSRDPNCLDEDKAEFGQEAWNETQSILDSLNLHVCNLDAALIYMSREYIYNTRMAITNAFRSLQGLNTRMVTTRAQAEEWIYYQEQVISRVKNAMRQLTTNDGQMLTRRPYQANWYSNQLALCLILWNNDRSLHSALELAKSFMIPVDAMNALWPCSYNHQQCADFRKQLTEACAMTGLEPPLSTSASLPSPLQITL